MLKENLVSIQLLKKQPKLVICNVCNETKENKINVTKGQQNFDVMQKSGTSSG